MKKVLVVVSDMKQGGITTSVINFCNELVKRGENVTFLNMGRGNIIEKKLDKTVKKINLTGKTIYWNLGMDELKQISLKNKIKLILMAILKKMTNHSEKWLKIIFYRYCLEEKYDVAIAFRQCSPCYYFVLNCVKAKKKIAFIHGDINYMGNISTWDIYFDQFDAIACVSKAVRNGFQKKYSKIQKKFVTIYNMFNTMEIKKLAEMNLKEFHLKNDICNIVTVARIENETKRIEIIPKICKRLKEDKCDKFHWYIVGDGPDLRKNKEIANRLKVNDVLTFCGAMENPYSIMKKASFMVLPSKTEAYSMVVIEAMILEKPIIVSYYNGLEEAISNKETGLIVDQSIEDLLDKVKLLILDNKELLRITLNLKKLKINNDKAYNQFLKSIS